jgi:hypothetical protein
MYNIYFLKQTKTDGYDDMNEAIVVGTSPEDAFLIAKEKLPMNVGHVDCEIECLGPLEHPNFEGIIMSISYNPA